MKKFLAVIIIFSMLFVGTGAFSVSANSSTVITPYWLNVTSVIGVVGYNDSGTVGTVSISINGVASVSRITATIMLYYKNRIPSHFLLRSSSCFVKFITSRSLLHMNPIFLVQSPAENAILNSRVWELFCFCAYRRNL